jgi:hypothetical protein
MMVIDNKFEIGSIVYLKTDKDQNERIIRQINIDVSNSIQYSIAYGSCISWHYDFEITAEKNVLSTSTN